MADGSGAGKFFAIGIFACVSLLALYAHINGLFCELSTMCKQQWELRMQMEAEARASQPPTPVYAPPPQRSVVRAPNDTGETCPQDGAGRWVQIGSRMVHQTCRPSTARQF